MKYGVYNNNYKINRKNINDFIMVLDKDIKHGKMIIHKKDLDNILDNAFKKVMKSKLRINNI